MRRNDLDPGTQSERDGDVGRWIGRAAVWGMATGAEAGCRSVLATLRDEVARTMILVGADATADITARHLPGPSISEGGSLV